MAYRMRSRTNWPPGSWSFIDAAISNTPLTDGSWSFNVLVNEVIKRRRANPRFNLSTDFNTVVDEVDRQNAARVSRIQGADSYVLDDGGGGGVAPVFPNGPTKRPNVVARSNKVSAGVKVLIDWLGSGATPVDLTLANQRASKCASGCPANDKGDWTRFFTVPASDMIRKQVEMAHEMSLHTAEDSKLQVCTACLCPLKTKVWVPIEHIKTYLTEDTKEKLRAANKECWQISEIGVDIFRPNG